MKILIVSQYFWPESFRINDLALGLKEKGNEVHVLTGKPNYPKGEFFNGYNFFNKREEMWNGITIYRSSQFPRSNGSNLKLALNYLSFVFFSSLKAFFLEKKYDLIFVYEPSPITVGIPAILIGKKLKIPIYFWVQDLWPESVSVAGQVNNKLILKLLDNLTKWIYDNSKKILIQSEGFREYIINQGIEDSKIIYYPNSTESLYKIVNSKKEIVNLVPKVPFSIMFAGNLGEAQDFENIIEAARIIKKSTDDIHFIILGDGRKKDFILKRIKECELQENFHLLGSFPVVSMPDFFACADALLVTLKQCKIFSLTIPSKIQSYLACGKPIIGSLDGEGANLIKESKSGIVAPAGNSVSLAEGILELFQSSNSERNEMGLNAKKYFEDNFERELLLEKLLRIFNNKDG